MIALETSVTKEKLKSCSLRGFPLVRHVVQGFCPPRKEDGEARAVWGLPRP